MKKPKQTLLFTLLLPLLCALPVPGIAQDPAPKPPPVEAIEADQIGKTRNVHRSGSVWFAGQFTPGDIALIKERGIQRVITTRQDGEVDWDEKAQVEAAGLEWISVPFRDPETMTDEVFGRIRELLSGNETPTLFHCGSANRVGGVWLPYRVLDQGVPLKRAIEEAKTIGLRTPEYEEQALAYIERQRGREEGVKKGINESFKNPDLDVESFIQRFEVETREVFAAREQILNALELRAGMVVADVGAGTGLFSLPLAGAVGSEGWVYAVDIAPKFLLHILTRATEAKVQNLSPVLCSETAIGLPAASLDLVYICDTYHHFEYPQSTLASIRRALKPDGRLVVLDFERIEGQTREWLLDHVRAGKDVFQAEIEQAGFELAREIELEGLKENYFLEFRRGEK